MASDWEWGIEVALANPDLTIVTFEGDRFASTPAGAWPRVAPWSREASVEDAAAAAAKRSTTHRPTSHIAAHEADDAAHAVSLRTSQLADHRARRSAKRRPSASGPSVERLDAEGDELVDDDRVR